MNIKHLSSLVISGITLGVISIPLLGNSSNAQIQVEETNIEFPEDRVSFRCGAILEKEGKERTPATIAYVPQRNDHVAIVAWTNNLAAWNPERRCEEVSKKFQRFHEDGRLDYLTDGESEGYPIICALPENEKECSGENQLFQVRAGSNSKDVIVGLEDILDGKTTGADVIRQGSGKKIYISVSGLLEHAPAIEDESLISK